MIKTEFGKLQVGNGEIVVIQRGMKFAVELNGPSRGWIAELYEGHLTLPERGPIGNNATDESNASGANGLANERDFLHPVACYEDRQDIEFSVLHKYAGNFFTYQQTSSPFDVVAYQGNYVPYKYDLQRFCAMNSVTYDHPVGSPISISNN